MAYQIAWYTNFSLRVISTIVQEKKHNASVRVGPLHKSSLHGVEQQWCTTHKLVFY